MEFDIDLFFFSVRYDGIEPEYIPEIKDGKAFFDIERHKGLLLKNIPKNRKRIRNLALFEAYCIWLQTSYAEHHTKRGVAKILNRIARNIPEHNRRLSKAFEEDLCVKTQLTSKEN